MLKLPYGISNFETLVNENYLYIDRTPYLRQIEQLNERYLFFLRPRRFGKSLWISVLQYYYGLEHKNKFETLFGRFHIGQNPTPLANTYLILKFDFSGIDTDSREKTYRGFSFKVEHGIRVFLETYSAYFSSEDRKDILSKSAPEIMISSLFAHFQQPDIPKIYVIIDEYDHFTNELISFRLNEFQEIVSENGYVRKFYEVIKTATHEGAVDRFFATGVSPITLDSMTSGFNMGSNISLDAALNEMMGFTQEEVRGILKGVEIADSELDGMMDEMRKWYNGYLFDADGKERMYNSDMVLYFANEYQKRRKYPRSLLDINISSDYGKLGKLFRLGGEESKRWDLLQRLLRGEEVSAQLTEQFSFARKFTEYDFLSLLFYMGLITIKKADLSEVQLQIPNEVIRELYYNYFLEQIQFQKNLDITNPDVVKRIQEFAKYNNPQPLILSPEDTLKQLSNQRLARF
ncbi:MAG: AAA family ATPase [Bacteroidia bacterium]